MTYPCKHDYCLYKYLILLKIALLPYASYEEGIYLKLFNAERDPIHQLYHLRIKEIKFNILATVTVTSPKERSTIGKSLKIKK